jgi:hypothetical protein
LAYPSLYSFDKNSSFAKMPVATRAKLLEGAELLGRMRFGVDECNPVQLEEMLRYIDKHRDMLAARGIVRAVYNTTI